MINPDDRIPESVAMSAWYDWRFWLIVKDEWPGWSRMEPDWHPAQGYVYDWALDEEDNRP